MPFFAITAVGQDRPGIVSELTGALFRQGCNLEDATMTRLRGQFAILVLVFVPAAESILAIESALQLTASRLGLSLVVRPLDTLEEPGVHPEPGQGYILRVSGADQPGIVHRATELLAGRGLNITDLNTRVIPGARGPVYVMLLEVDIPSPAVAEALREELDRLSQALPVDISFEPLDEETL
jgi:glycine cleavage system transcriptional repressor